MPNIALTVNTIYEMPAYASSPSHWSPLQTRCYNTHFLTHEQGLPQSIGKTEIHSVLTPSIKFFPFYLTELSHTTMSFIAWVSISHILLKAYLFLFERPSHKEREKQKELFHAK